MNMQHLETAGLIAVTLISYVFVRRLYLRSNGHPLVNIVVICAGLIIALLVARGKNFADYSAAKDIMTFPLGPATVALGVPLYRYRLLLREYAGAIVGGVTVGSLISMLVAGGIAKLGGLPWDVVISVMPKGVSIPFAVEVARFYDGIPALSSAFVVATGTLGSFIGPWLLARAGIAEPVARGLALGTMCHAQGTAMALMEGPRQGAMAGLAMILAGIFTALSAPFVVRLLKFL